MADAPKQTLPGRRAGKRISRSSGTGRNAGLDNLKQFNGTRIPTATKYFKSAVKR